MGTVQQERHAPPPRPPLPQISAARLPASGTVQPTADLTTHMWSYRDLQKVHDMAYRLVDAGLAADEKEDLGEAATSYTEGLRLLDQALRVNCEKLLQSTTDQINQAKQMQQKMNKTRQQISFRLQTIEAKLTGTSNQQAAPIEPTAPPSYDEAISEPPSLPPSYEDDELTALGESLMCREISHSDFANAEELFTIADGVQIFYITAEGYVSAPTYPTSLHIVRLLDEPQTSETDTIEAPVFLHVGDWVFPLIPGASPALHTNYGAYLFPDITTSEPGSAVGVLIPDTMSQEMKQEFEAIIRSLTVYGEQSPSPSPVEETPTAPLEETVTGKPGEQEVQREVEELDTAGKISKGLSIAAEWIAWGVSKGAEKAAVLVRQGSEKIQKKYKPADRAHKIDPKVQKGVIYAREATNGAVKVTGYIVNKLGALTVALAKEVAPHIKRQGMKILPQSMKSENSHGRSKVDGVVEVAASGLKGFGTVYLGLETAAKILGRSLADETVNIVTRRYGEEAGVLAENTMYTGGNVVMTAYNANHLGVKAIAKRAAKETGKAVITDLNESKVKKDPYSPSSSTSVKSTPGASSSSIDKKP